MRLALICCAFLAANITMGIGGVSPNLAQEQAIPARSLVVANHLRNLKFEKVSSGISALKALAPNGVELIVLRLKPTKFQFYLALPDNRSGEWVEDIGKRKNAQIVFNGGFFSIDKRGHKNPVGLLAKGKVKYSSAWKKSGGYLYIRDGNISIVPTKGNPVPVGDWVLQSKPVLIEPGGKWAMNTNKAIAKKRTIVCMDGDGDLIIMAIVGGGLSLYEAGWLMRDTSVGGYFGCNSAIAMDGGGSTQIWVKDRPDLSFGGQTPVHNSVIIRLQQPK